MIILLDEKTGIQNYRTIWISDTHLGTPGAQAKALLHFLKYTHSETLYLVGDIVDGWQLKKRFYWPQEHNDVVQKLLRKARNGTRVIYIPGNHDEAARHYLGVNFGDIAIKQDDIHETADGKRLWVVHGDLFDNVIQHARWLAYLGDRAYTLLLRLNRLLNGIRNLLNMPYWSLSQYLKHRVKSAISFISAFETAMLTETRRRRCDGVVCGHIHKPEMREVDGVLYANDGDWVESLSALVEHHDGRLELLDWQHAETTTTWQINDQFVTPDETNIQIGASA
ncbi:MAG: UDP-2,3-diacylglucosamine diphosphatase [Candidatus Puniceispirillaceae bacterium]